MKIYFTKPMISAHNQHIFIPPATKLGGGYTGITLSIRPSVCRRARLGKIARLGIGCCGGYFVPLGQPHSSLLKNKAWRFKRVTGIVSFTTGTSNRLANC